MQSQRVVRLLRVVRTRYHRGHNNIRQWLQRNPRHRNQQFCQGAVGITGAAVTVVDEDAIDLGASTVSGTYTVTAGEQLPIVVRKRSRESQQFPQAVKM